MLANKKPQADSQRLESFKGKIYVFSEPPPVIEFSPDELIANKLKSTKAFQIRPTGVDRDDSLVHLRVEITRQLKAGKQGNFGDRVKEIIASKMTTGIWCELVDGRGKLHHPKSISGGGTGVLVQPELEQLSI